MKKNKEAFIQATNFKQWDLCLEEQNRSESLNNLNQKILKRKFYNPHIQSYYYRNLNDILYNPYSQNYIQFQEMSHLCRNAQNLILTFSFQQICSSIKKTILKRVQKDTYGIIDFKGEHYKLTLGYYLRKKQFNKSKRGSKNIYKSTLSTQQTAQDKNLLQLLQTKDKIPTKNYEDIQLDLVSNISQIQLRRLVKKLDIMADSALNKKSKVTVKQNYNNNNNLLLSPRKKASQKELFFKFQLQKKISIITKNQADKIVPEKQVQIKADKYLEVQTVKQSYGLQMFKKDNNKKKKHLKSSDKLIPQKQITIPMTPKPRFYHGTTQYDENYRQKQCKQMTTSRGNKNVSSTPLSPGNNRSLQNKSKLTCSKKSSLSSKKQKGNKNNIKSNSNSKKYF